MKTKLIFFLALLWLCYLLPASEKAAVEPSPPHGIGEILPLWSVLPFLGILLSIALFPLLAARLWAGHYGKISVFWSLLFFIPFWICHPASAVNEALHIIILDYVPFLILLWSLFTISGGILIRGTLSGTPAVNTALLFSGTLLSSWIGTTGSAMLLIRPVIRANRHRSPNSHVIVFFIFLVANIGGSLTPLGDPPLFLGFLHGVPFFWTFHIFPHMALASAILLILFYVIDRRYFRKEKKPPEKKQLQSDERLKVMGLQNLLFLSGVIGAVLLSGLWHPGKVSILGVPVEIENLLRNGILLGMGSLSLHFTPRTIRRENEFHWHPIAEVAILFAGIFVTMIPAIAILKAGEKGALAFLMRAVREPSHYFWATGSLSSFLDNAPTYLTYFSSALGNFVNSNPLFLARFPAPLEIDAVRFLISNQPAVLAAISAGAVFMGANTYIGNAPNFMVKSIAEENHIAMPSFFGYMFKYSIPILIPIFILITLIFF